jgi:hypothetical protein
MTIQTYILRKGRRRAALIAAATALAIGTTVAFLAGGGHGSAPVRSVPSAAAPTPETSAGPAAKAAQGPAPTPAPSVAQGTYHAPTAAPVSHVAMPAPMPIGAPARAPIDPRDRLDFVRAARAASASTSAAAAHPAAPQAPARPASTAPPPPAPQSTPQPPVFPLPPPPQISDVRVDSVDAYSATISWHTDVPTVGRASYGIAGTFVWSAPDQLGTEHSATIDGLSFGTPYVARAVSTDAFGQTVRSGEMSLTTLPMPEKTSGTRRDGTILVNDHPVFPIMAWAGCSGMWEPLLADGLNTFMGNGCGPDAEMVEAVKGRAYTLVGLDHSGIDGRGVIGRYWRDEWDAFLPSTLTTADLDRMVPKGRSDRLDFLTMTSHVYTGAAPLEQGKGMYPALLGKADVLGFDIYPLQSWCDFAKLPAVFDAQRDLRARSGKPTYQWIEVGPMEHQCGQRPENAVTPAIVNAETWLALAGGASGIGYFPAYWEPEIGRVIAANNRSMKELQPALLGAADAAATADNGVVVGAHTRNGALYVIAVNPAHQPVRAQITVTGLAGRALSVYGESRSVTPTGDVLADDFAPLSVHVYIAAPAGV